MIFISVHELTLGQSATVVVGVDRNNITSFVAVLDAVDGWAEASWLPRQ